MNRVERLNERQRKFRAEGRCIACGGETSPGKARCDLHLLYQRRYHRERRAAIKRAPDLCNRCGRRRPCGGRKSCDHCYELGRANSRARRDRRLAQGLCQDCGVNPHRPDRKSCADCAYQVKLKQAGVTL